MGRSKTLEAYSSELGKRVLEKLAASALEKDDAVALGMRELSPEEMAQLGYAPRGGFLIPYFDLQGTCTRFHRVRFLDDPPVNGFNFKPSKVQKYAQRPGTLNELYLPPSAPWLEIAQDVSIAITVTEGELKAACANKFGIATIGLGGVFNFMAKKAGLLALPMFDEIVWQNRDVNVCFDSDAVTNPMVKAAEAMLARMLLKRGAVPRIVRLPSINGDDKTGLDDWLTVQEDPKDAFLNLCASQDEVDQITKELHRLNEELVVVDHPACVMQLADGAYIKYADFINITHADRIAIETSEDKKGNIKVTEVPAAKKWLKWRGRNHVKALVYEPGEAAVLPGNKMNLWHGWAEAPHKGTVEPFTNLLDYLFQGDTAAQTWFTQWLAYPVQHPGAKLYSACVLWGAQTGTGKSLLAVVLTRLYGEHGTIINEGLLKGRFNSFMKCRSLIVGEEITGSDSRKMANQIKEMITRPKVYIENKGLDVYELEDHCNYLLLSNHPDAFKIDVHDRRYFVWETPMVRAPKALYKAVDTWMRTSEGIAALHDWLLHVDTSTFDPMGEPVVTASKQAMITDGQSDLESWVSRLSFSPAEILPAPWELATAEELLYLYEPDAQRRAVKSNGMGRALKSQGFQQATHGQGVRLSNNTQQRIFVIAADTARRQELLSATASKIKSIYEAERKNTKQKGAKLR